MSSNREQIAALPPFLPIPKPNERCVVGDLSRTHLYRLISDGYVRAVKTRDKTLIETASLLDYLANLPTANIKLNRPAGDDCQSGRRRRGRPRKPRLDPAAATT